MRSDDLAAAYERARPRLVRVAYAVLGSWAEAEDVVADCWLRLVAADRDDPVRDVDAWATVVVARAALDTLRSARMRRETYPGPWLPEPVIDLDAPATDPADRVTLDHSVGYALLVVLETLTPAERTAWVLHDLFGMPFAEVADVVGRSAAAVRQLAARARSHVEARTPRVTVSPADHSSVVRRFLDAAVGGDLDTLLRALDPDVVLVSDGGGEVSAAVRPVVGAERVGRFLQGIAGRLQPDAAMRVVSVNGGPGLAVIEGGVVSMAAMLTVSDARIIRIDIVRAPAKLRRHT